MKISEFRKLIREEVRKVVKERDEDISREDIIDRFENYGIENTSKFNLTAAAKKMKMPEQSAAIVIQNLEDDRIMQDLANGIYNTIKPHDLNYNQFNDEYTNIYKTYKIGKYIREEQMQHQLTPGGIRENNYASYTPSYTHMKPFTQDLSQAIRTLQVLNDKIETNGPMSEEIVDALESLETLYDNIKKQK